MTVLLVFTHPMHFVLQAVGKRRRPRPIVNRCSDAPRGHATIAALLIALMATVGAPSGHAAHLQDAQVRTPDGPRPYVMALPDAGLPAGAPLVILLHGHGGNASNTLGRGPWRSALSAWLAIADRERVAVVALQGSTAHDGRPGWNDCRADTPDPPDTDDVAYVAAVVSALRDRQGIDPRRVYVMGMSNGAMMALRLAQELEPAPAGVAAVAGLMAAHSECRPPARAVPVLLIAGTADPLVPYGGGDLRIGPLRRGSLLSAEATAAAWRTANGQPASAQTYHYPHRTGGDDPTQATRLLWHGNPAAPNAVCTAVRRSLTAFGMPQCAPYEYGTELMLPVEQASASAW